PPAPEGPSMRSPLVRVRSATAARARHDDSVRRALGGAALLGLAAVHLLALPSAHHEAAWLAPAFAAVAAAAVALAGVLAAVPWWAAPSWAAWPAAAGLATATGLGYAVSRVVGLPHAGNYVGRWEDPLGLASLGLEAVVVALAAGASAQIV
ncbi:MAG TPA: hypothetical protein VKP11_02625, partial [Frankiaceae bacterium]|nr:hypothetical protein [Frankiaceae bacterium]